MKLAVYLTLCTLSVKLIASWSIEANNSGISQIRTSKLKLPNDIFNKGESLNLSREEVPSLLNHGKQQQYHFLEK